jgi:hypothetical protein
MGFRILGGLLPLKPRAALKDAVAGFTLASMNAPQVLGYTRIAGTPVLAAVGVDIDAQPQINTQSLEGS